MRLNFVLPEVGNNQITNTLTQYSHSLPNNVSAYIFTPSQTSVILKPNIPVFDVVDIYAQYGVGIATEISMAGYILSALNLDVKCLYLQNLEWINTNANFFLQSLATLSQMDLVICRSQFHKEYVEKYMNRKVDGVMQDINWDTLVNLINTYRQTHNIEETQHSNRLVTL